MAIGEIVDYFSFNNGVITVDVVNFLKPEEVFIGGDEMIRRAKALRAMTDLRDVGIVLRHSDKIPATCDMYDLVFAGAKLWVKIPNGNHCEFIAYLRKTKTIWRLGYGSVGFDWDEKARLIRFSMM